MLKHILFKKHTNTIFFCYAVIVIQFIRLHINILSTQNTTNTLILTYINTILYRNVLKYIFLHISKAKQ